MRDFAEKVVVITGAADGIGLETARAFAGRGARIAICDIDGSRLSDAAGELAANGGAQGPGRGR